MATQSASQRTVSTPNGPVRYILIRKEIRRLNIRVQPDGTVEASAPLTMPVREVDRFVAEKSNWIARAQSRQQVRQDVPAPVDYADGEPILILGRVCQLRVKQGVPERAFLEGDVLHLTVKDSQDRKARYVLVQQFWSQQCKEEFLRLLRELQPPMAALGVPFPSVTVQEMTSRWGSCRPAREAITLNRCLLAEPEDCIRYVVLHELCHFVHPNHSKQFYALVAQFMPDWEARVRYLKARAPYRLSLTQEDAI